MKVVLACYTLTIIITSTSNNTFRICILKVLEFFAKSTREVYFNVLKSVWNGAIIT